jgi:hypothetical protein
MRGSIHVTGCLVVLLACALAPNSFGARSDANDPPPVVTVSPSTVDFGDQVASEASAPKRITIANGGSAKVFLDSVKLGGDAAGDFALSNDACTGTSLEPGKSCVVDVVMTPSETGPRAATITITADGVEAAATVELSGNGINSVAVPPQ